MSVLNNKALHEQLSIIMGALTKAAVAEICEVVDEGYLVLQLEISRSRKENEDLKKKLHLIESILVRGGSRGQTPEDTGAMEVIQPPETQQQQRDRDRGEAAASSGEDGGAARVELEELPEVVLIKDEDSDSDHTVEEESRAPADGGAAAAREDVLSALTNRRRRRRWSQGQNEVTEKPSSSSEHQLTAGTQKKVSIYNLDSPRSEQSCSSHLIEEVQMEAGDSVSSYQTKVDPDIDLVQHCSLVSQSSSRQMFFSSSALMEAPSSSNSTELDLNVEPGWTKQSNGPASFTQFHQNEDTDDDAFGLKLISVCGSTSKDCQLSNSRSSTFEYVGGADALNFGLYRDQLSQLSVGPQSPSSQRKRFMCSICNKTYATSQNLEVHMRIHTGERPFTCDQCGKKFTQSAHLKSHLNVHSGERPFSCTVCDKNFIVKYSLKLHMKKCHPTACVETSCSRTFYE